MVHVSTYQGKPFWYRFFEPQPYIYIYTHTHDVRQRHQSPVRKCKCQAFAGRLVNFLVGPLLNNLSGSMTKNPGALQALRADSNQHDPRSAYKKLRHAKPINFRALCSTSCFLPLASRTPRNLSCTGKAMALLRRSVAKLRTRANHMCFKLSFWHQHKQSLTHSRTTVSPAGTHQQSTKRLSRRFERLKKQFAWFKQHWNLETN